MAEYTGGYEPQTRPTFFRGKKALDPSKRMRDEAALMAKRDEGIIKDMMKQHKDLQKAHEVWNKNQALVDKEKIEFWKSLQTVPKDVKDTLEARKKIVRAEAVRKANEDYENKDDEERSQDFEFYSSLLKKDNDLGAESEERAQTAEKNNMGTDVATYFRGKSKTYINQMMYRIGKEYLYSFPEVSKRIWNDNEQEYTYKGKKFKATDNGLLPEQEAIVYRHIRDVMMIGATGPTGFDLTAANSLLGKQLDEMLNRDRFKRSEARGRVTADNAIIENRSNLSTALGAIEIITRPDGTVYHTDPLDFAGLLLSHSRLSPGRYLASSNNSQGGIRSKDDIDHVLAQLVAEHGDEGMEIVNYILNNPEKFPYLQPGTKDKLVGLMKVDGKTFNTGRYNQLTTSGGSVSTGLGKVNTFAEGEANKKLIDSTGYTKTEYHVDGLVGNKLREDLTDEELEDHEGTILGQLMKRAKTERIPPEDLIQIAKDLNGPRELTLAILNFDGDAHRDAEVTSRILNSPSVNESGQIIVPEGVILDDATLTDAFQENPDLEIAPAYNANEITARKETAINIERAVSPTGNLTPSQYLITEKLEQLQTQEEIRLRKEDRLQPGGPTKTREQIIREANKNVLDNFAENINQATIEKDGQQVTNEFYRDQDGEFPAILASNRWNMFSGNTAAMKEAELELQKRELQKLNRDKGGGDLTANVKIPNIRGLLTGSTRHINRNGSPHPRLVELANELNVNVYKLINDQAAVYGLTEQGETYVEVPETAATFLGSVRNEDVNDLVKRLSKLNTDPLNKYMPNNLATSLSASREVEGFLTQVQQKNGVTAIRPNESALQTALSFTDNGDYKAESPSGHLGRYRISEKDAKETCIKLGIPYPGKASFLKNEGNIQDKVYTARMNTLIDKAPGNTTIEKLRWIHREWTGTQNVGTVELDERTNQETFFIHRYTEARRGGP